jgi:hypothetical protein
MQAVATARATIHTDTAFKAESFGKLYMKLSERRSIVHGTGEQCTQPRAPIVGASEEVRQGPTFQTK